MSKAHPSSKVTAPKGKIVLTPENAIQEIRNLRAGKLAVLNVEYIDLLLANYDKRGAELILARGAANDLTGALDAEKQQHADTRAELDAVLDNKKYAHPTVNLQELGELLLTLAPGRFTADMHVIDATIHELKLLKEADDINGVCVRDLMATIKRQELQLAAFGVAVNPNPDIPTFKA